MEPTLLDMIVTGAIMSIIVGYFIYRLATSNGSIRDKDQTVMDLLREIQMMSTEEQDRVRVGIKNNQFSDKGPGNDNGIT